MAFSVLLLPPPATAAGEIVRTVGPGRVDVVAQSVALYPVLDALTRHVGASLTCPGQKPRQRVTITLRNVTPVEAVTRILEGAGVGYVLRSDRSGAGLEALDLVENSSTTASAGPARAETDGTAKETDSEPDDEPMPTVSVPAEEPAPVEPVLTHGSGAEAPPWPSPPSSAPSSIAPEPFPEAAIPASDGSWPTGMGPIAGVEPPGSQPPPGPESAAAAPAPVTESALPAPPVAAPGKPGPVGAPPPGMRLTGPPPTTPPPQPQ